MKLALAEAEEEIKRDPGTGEGEEQVAETSSTSSSWSKAETKVGRRVFFQSPRRCLYFSKPRRRKFRSAFKEFFGSIHFLASLPSLPARAKVCLGPLARTGNVATRFLSHVSLRLLIFDMLVVETCIGGFKKTWFLPIAVLLQSQWFIEHGSYPSRLASRFLHWATNFFFFLKGKAKKYWTKMHTWLEKNDQTAY